MLHAKQNVIYPAVKRIAVKFAGLMQAPIRHKIGDQTFWLSAQRSLFWEEQKALIVSDLHFGKTGHFRKSGIGVPQGIYKEDLQRLITLLHYFNSTQLIVVGDFFHSHANVELDLFKRWRADFKELSIILVKGNHDILQKDWYEEANIKVVDNLYVDNFYFSHEPEDRKSSAYTFSGHIHPGVVLKGLGKQSLRFPCFYFTKQYSVLPAFSRFTGVAAVEPKKTDTVFAIVENTLIQLQ